MFLVDCHHTYFCTSFCTGQYQIPIHQAKRPDNIDPYIEMTIQIKCHLGGKPRDGTLFDSCFFIYIFFLYFFPFPKLPDINLDWKLEKKKTFIGMTYASLDLPFPPKLHFI